MACDARKQEGNMSGRRLCFLARFLVRAKVQYDAPSPC